MLRRTAAVMTQYALLPRSSSDAEKDWPRFRRRFHLPSLSPLLRKCRRHPRLFYSFLGLIVLLVWQTVFNTLYTSPPPFSIPPDETVYIAANIIDADLINGAWGKSLLQLVDLIGKDRVFVSIYGGPRSALAELGPKLECRKSLVAEERDPISLKSIPHTHLPTGEERIKRIAYLAEVRNKALQPLKYQEHFDKVLFINDVFFKPMDAARLLWGTNVKDGKSTYNAVCGTDFVTSWKYYDTYGTRDLEGYSIGVPIFPWFANEGDAVSRKDVLAGKDAVRVKSCWGGMVAFDAKYFMEGGISIPTDTPKSLQHPLPNLPLRFRSEPEPFWDSSECCLIHADIMSLSNTTEPKFDDQDPGIYMNPFVRVAYDAHSFRNIFFAKRFERLLALPQAIINYYARMPIYNPRRTEVEGEVIKDRVWVSAKPDANIGTRATIGQEGGLGNWEGRGHYEEYERVATRGGYCGVRQLLVLKEGEVKEGEGNWDNLRYEVPPLG